MENHARVTGWQMELFSCLPKFGHVIKSCKEPIPPISEIAHFTVAGENEGGVDLVLIQPFLLYYVNHVFLMLTSIFLAKFTL